jgi:hypothetical protein
MTTPRRTDGHVSYAVLEQRARLDLAARTLANPRASAEHLRQARKILASEGTAGAASAIAACDLIAGLTPHLVLELHEVCRKIAEHRVAMATPVTKPA